MSHDAYSALSDPTRRRILEALRGGPRPVGELVTELEVSQPTVSKHLKVLRDAQMVVTRAQGQKRFYSLTAEPLTEVVTWLEDLISAAPGTDEAQPAVAPPAAAEDDAAEPEAPASESTPDAPVSDRSGGSTTDETGAAVEPEGGAESADTGADDTAPVAGAAEQETPAEDAGAEAGPVADLDGADDAAAPVPAPRERALPWFTAEVTEITETDEGGVVEAEEEARQDTDEESDEPQGSAESEREAPSESDPEAAGEDAAPEAESTPDPEEPQITEDSLEAGDHTAPAARPEAEDDADPRDSAPRTTSSEAFSPESAEALRPRGGAHRRQSGLLSTLTGFRRRGRGTRRD